MAIGRPVGSTGNIILDMLLQRSGQQQSVVSPPIATPVNSTGNFILDAAQQRAGIQQPISPLPQAQIPVGSMRSGSSVLDAKELVNNPLTQAPPGAAPSPAPIPPSSRFPGLDLSSVQTPEGSTGNFIFDSILQAAGLQPRVQPLSTSGTPLPPTGLAGSELALNESLANAIQTTSGGATAARGDIATSIQEALAQITSTGGDVTSQIQAGVDPAQQFIAPGADAQQLIAALSGVGGQEAFDQALIDSPAQRFLQEQGELSVLRGASATGGLGGGEVQKELTRFGQGLASTRIQEQIDNLSTLTDQGLRGAGLVSALRGTQAGLTSNLGITGAGIIQQGGFDLADITGGATRDISDALLNVGQLTSARRTGAGQDIATAIGGTTSALSELINQQGAGVSDLTGAGGANIIDILTQAGGAQGLSQEQLAELLARISAGQVAGVGGAPSIPGTQQTEGIVADLAALASGVGTAATGFGLGGGGGGTEIFTTQEGG